MNPCYSSNNFTVSDVSEINDIESGTTTDTNERSLCQDQLADQDQYLDPHVGSYVDVLLKDESFHSLDDNYEEKLFPYILELSKLDESNSKTADVSCGNGKLLTSRAAKRPFVDVEHGLTTSAVSPKRTDTKQSAGSEECYKESSVPDITNSYLVSTVDGIPLISSNTEVKNICCHEDRTFTEEITTTSIVKSDEQLVQHHPTVQQHATKKKLVLLYHRHNLFYTEFNSSIYKDAIKKISIDSNGLFRNGILEEIYRDDRYIGLKLSIDLSVTYSNVRKYILNKVSPFINNIMPTADVLVTSGMSASDMKCSCISNHYFFEKLRENCKKIIEDIRLTPNDCFSNVFQSSIGFSYENCFDVVYRQRNKFYSKRHKFLPKLKMLIIDTIYNLPQSIISVIENFDKNEIASGLFSSVHGVFISKYSIRNLVLFFNCNKDKIIKNKLVNAGYEDNLYLLNNFLEKIGNLLRTSAILYEEEVFLPDESLVEKMSKYILSDMYGIPVKFHKKLKLHAKNILESHGLISNSEIPNQYLQLPKLNLTTTDTTQFLATNAGIEMNNLHNPEASTEKEAIMSIPKNVEQLELCPSSNLQYATCETFKEYVTLGELMLKPHRCNVYSAKALENIYEYAIKKVSIDKNGLFKSSLLEELDSLIVGNGFSKSSIDLSSTYSDVRKYVLDKVSPSINSIIPTTDKFITTGMSLSDMKFNFLSNHLFFEKLREDCEKMVEGIRVISEDVFLSMVRHYIRFGSDDYLNIVSRKKIICSKIKELIIETMYNLPQSIIFEIENFEQGEILRSFFSHVHGVFISKSLIRNINYYFNFDKNKFLNVNFKKNLIIFNKLFVILGRMVKTSFIFHEGKALFPDGPTVELLSKYLLSDICGFPPKLHKNLNLFTENIVELHGSSGDVGLKSINCKKDVVNDTYENTGLKLSSVKSTLIPKINSRWDPNSITSLNIYELAISMINIDKEEFENSFINKVRYKELEGTFHNLNKFNLNFSVTYDRIKNYILEVFSPFLKEVREETKLKINMHHEITLDELEHAYISNGEFFAKLSKFCDEAINLVGSIDPNTLTDMMQYVVYLETESESPKKIEMRKKRRLSFSKDIAQLLIHNISVVPGKIIDAIRMLPRSKLVEEYFSRFDDMYVDNKSLLKAKLIFDSTKEKIINDKMLSGLLDKISSDIIDGFGNAKSVDVSRNLYKFINSYIVHEKLSTIKYIRKLVRHETPAFRCNLSDPIVIVYGEKTEIANKKIKSDMLHKLESGLIAFSVGLYKSLCFKAYKLKIGR